MKRIQKLRLPMWIVRKLPFGYEEEELSAVIVPAFIFLVMGVATACYNWFTLKWVVLWILGILFVFCAALGVICWIVIQTTLLEKIREELVICYRMETDLEKKLLIGEKLNALCVSMEEAEQYPLNSGK